MSEKKAAKVAIGGDPEVFVRDSKGIIPVCGLIGGTKDAPVLFSETKKQYSWLEDNVSLEFNFPPVDDPYTFNSTINDMLVRAEHQLKLKGLMCVIKPYHTFTPIALAHPSAQSIGCLPDHCAYDNARKRVVSPSQLGTNRFCGGHIHLSYDKKERIPAYAVTMLLDAFIGMPSVTVDPQGPRRALYGLAGLYREKPYGVEYRTLSNWWLKETSMRIYMAQTILSIGKAIDESPLELANLFSVIPFKDVQQAINKEDAKLAHDIFRYIRRHPHTKDAGVSCNFGDYTL